MLTSSEALILSVRRVNHDDLDAVLSWLKGWGKVVDDPSIFPEVGFIVENIAVGFVYLTDSSLAIIDCYISNPESDSKTRSHALDLITTNLLSVIKERGYRVIKCDTQIEAVKKRAAKFGFQPTGVFSSFILTL